MKFDPLIINLSLPKTSSSSLKDFCSEYVSATHESWHSGLTVAIIEYFQQRYDITSLLNYYTLRDIALEHKVDSSTFNHFIAADLVKSRSNSVFIYIYRDPISWISSFLNMWLSFYYIHKHNLDNSTNLTSSVSWINWINDYSTLYSSHLNTSLVHQCSLDLFDKHCHSDIFQFLINDLANFWMTTSSNMLNLTSSTNNIHIFSISNWHSLSKFIMTTLNVASDPASNIVIPRSNQSDLKNYTEFKFDQELIKDHLSSNLLNSIYECYDHLKSKHFISD